MRRDACRTSLPDCAPVILLALSVSGVTVFGDIPWFLGSAHTLSALVFAAALVLAVARLGWPRVRRSSIVYLLLCLTFIGYVWASQSWSASVTYSEYKARFMVWNLIPLCGPLLIVRTAGDFRRYCRSSIFWLTTSLLNAALFRQSDLIRGTFGEPIGAGRTGGTLTLMAVTALPWLGWFAVLGIATLGTVATFLSGTRAAFWSLSVMMPFSVLAIYGKPSGKGHSKLWTLIYSLLLILALIALFEPSILDSPLAIDIWHRLQQLPLSEQAIADNRRWTLLTYGISLWLKKPIRGWGIGSYGVLLAGSDIRAYPHNLIVELLSELGLIGVVLFAMLVVSATRGLRSPRGLDRVMVWIGPLTLIYAGLTGLFSLDMPNMATLWFAIGLSAAVPSVRENTMAQSEEPECTHIGRDSHHDLDCHTTIVAPTRGLTTSQERSDPT